MRINTNADICWKITTNGGICVEIDNYLLNVKKLPPETAYEPTREICKKNDNFGTQIKLALLGHVTAHTLCHPEPKAKDLRK